jgi:hypothetical protein
VTRVNPISDEMHTDWSLSKYGNELARLRTSRKLVGRIEDIMCDTSALDPTTVAVIEGLCRAIKSLELPP